MRVALVLSGGGARAAYQVGAIRALAEISGAERPFSIFTGVSAGAINAAALASYADDFRSGAAHLWETWRTMSPEHVYRTDARSLGAIGSRWLRELSGGGLGAGHVNHLLDTSPLRALLEETLHLQAIQSHLDRHTLRAVAVSATNYHSGTAVTFYAREPSPLPPIEPWVRSMRLGREAVLRLDHVLASAAIPIFFPPVLIDGAFFGDGSIRLHSPLSPAVHMGAERIVAIGIRYWRSPRVTTELNVEEHSTAPSLSEIGGVLLNSVFLDSLEGDVERLERINKTVSSIRSDHRPALRQIPILVLRPSADLGRLAASEHQHFPRVLRYLMRGIGVTGVRGADLMSYLAFVPSYLSQLLELGYHDTLERRREVEAFLNAPPVEEARAPD